MRRLARSGLFLSTLVVGPAGAQQVTWVNRVTLYGDNTEFFTPYREGETILGGQFTSRIVVKPAPKFAVHAGVFGDVRWGSAEFLDDVKPILSFRYLGTTSLGVVGTLETTRRHGLIEPLQVTTLELTRPIEYGLQWIERRRWWEAEAYINWQALNTPTQREVFDYGSVLKARPIKQVTIEAQLHGLHHGGQLFNAGVPVTNNVASGLGVTVADTIKGLGYASLQVFRMRSSGDIDPNPPVARPDRGRGTYLRAGYQPARGVELFGIVWRGWDFLSQEGDNNYNSAGRNPSFFRSRRKYLELGVLRRAVLEGAVELDAEFRLHRIDDEPSIAIGHSSWEYSYRLVFRTPFQFNLK